MRRFAFLVSAKPGRMGAVRIAGIGFIGGLAFDNIFDSCHSPYYSN